MNHDVNAVAVIGERGLRGSCRQLTPGELGDAGRTVDVTLDDGRHMVVPASLLDARDDGTYHLPLGPDDIDKTMAGDAGVGRLADAGEKIVIPVVEEQVEIRKQRVETGGVRVKTTTRERNEVVDVPLERTDVSVERVKVDRPLDAPPEVRQEGDVLIIPVVEEVFVVEKRLMLREEIRVTTRTTRQSVPQTVTLRRQEAVVERIPPEKS